MRYLGGKSRIAKEIAQVVAPQGFWWEPFCGGLSVSVQLAKFGPGLVSDANPALIALYQAVRDGWVPPEALTLEEWREAKTLPDSDPRKAFAGFGCSFRGIWFGGYAPAQDLVVKSGAGMGAPRRNRPAAGAKRALLRDIPALAHCHFRLLSFFDVAPQTSPSVPETIYADPPYSGTTGYDATGSFDHGRFWAYCLGWAERGARVFVSELSCPVGKIVWEQKHTHTIKGTGSAPITERLFRVHAPSIAKVS